MKKQLHTHKNPKLPACKEWTSRDHEEIVIRRADMKYSRRDFGLLLIALAANASGAQEPFLLAGANDTTKLAPAGNTSALELDIRDYATMPITGKVDGKREIRGLLARVNFMREEPGRGRKKRFFVNDLNGPLYILSK